MRNLFAVPWLTLSYRTVVTILAAVISVFSIFGLLKINSGIKTPAKEMLTGSIQRSYGVLKPASSDPMAAFIAPASTHSRTAAKADMSPNVGYCGRVLAGFQTEQI